VNAEADTTTLCGLSVLCGSISPDCLIGALSAGFGPSCSVATYQQSVFHATPDPQNKLFSAMVQAMMGGALYDDHERLDRMCSGGLL